MNQKDKDIIAWVSAFLVVGFGFYEAPNLVIGSAMLIICLGNLFVNALGD
ncbi:MAG: hypothetical protein FWG30_12090 [Eubacteriaceae bacterium]|nr:hypothetical protein [Eubacteriaceae bacterium]